VQLFGLVERFHWQKMMELYTIGYPFCFQYDDDDDEKKKVDTTKLRLLT
jgi:hypothetical protein